VQSRAVVMVSVPCPPVAGNADGAAATVTAQRSAEGEVTDVSVLVHPDRAIVTLAAAIADRTHGS